MAKSRTTRRTGSVLPPDVIDKLAADPEARQLFAKMVMAQTAHWDSQKAFESHCGLDFIELDLAIEPFAVTCDSVEEVMENLTDAEFRDVLTRLVPDGPIRVAKTS